MMLREDRENPVEQALTATEKACAWYAVSVRSRHEFVADEQLKKQGIESFLPTITKIRRWSDRGKAVVFPLFPGYLFVHVRPSAETFLKVLKTHGTVHFVSHIPGFPTPVEPEEIHSLRLMLNQGGEVDMYPHLWEGARVRVRRGPLQGAVGILVKKQDWNLFLVNVEILGRSIGMRIDAEELDVI